MGGTGFQLRKFAYFLRYEIKSHFPRDLESGTQEGPDFKNAVIQLKRARACGRHRNTF
jgi:hypothetical protein